MRYYIIAGEASGDLHAANLVKEIRKLDPEFRGRGWGGDLMTAQGVHLVKHYRELSFMGFVEVIANLKTILRNIEFCKRDILDFRPDVLILVDYPGFNLRIAEFAHKAGLKVVYYISPQVWAWKQSRVHKIKEYVNRMMVILPFEKEFYERFRYHVDFVGHPLLDAIADRQPVDDKTWRQLHGLDDKPVIALLPGSRKQEITTMLPMMLSVVPSFPGYNFVIGAAPAVPESLYTSLCGGSNIKIIAGGTYSLLEHAHAALVTSGTATLETALFNVPEVVCYKGNFISYQIARRLVTIDYISLVNLIMDRKVVTELIQSELNTKNLVAELKKLTEAGKERAHILSEYSVLREKLGGHGASARAAAITVETANVIS